jgi:purine nucleosidase
VTPPRPIVLDVDTGIDDALAILYACASPEVDLVAVACVAGNVPARQVAENTKALLELVGREHVPVALGAETPLVKPLATSEETHGPRGIGHATLPPARGALLERDASSAIVALARERADALHLVTLGPLTDLALALRDEPRLPSLLAGWTFMGGSFGAPGNTTPTAEWNVHVDPDAARECLARWAEAVEGAAGGGGEQGAAVPLRGPVALPLGMGLDVTEKARVGPREVADIAIRAGAEAPDVDAIRDRMEATGSVAANPVLRFVVDALRFYFEFHAANDGFFGAFVHDPFALAATLDPALVTTRPAFVDVETGPGLGHAMTVADVRGHLRRRPNVAVAVDGDAEAFRARLIERIGDLAARTGAASSRR